MTAPSRHGLFDLDHADPDRFVIRLRQGHRDRQALPTSSATNDAFARLPAGTLDIHAYVTSPPRRQRPRAEGSRRARSSCARCRAQGAFQALAVRQHQQRGDAVAMVTTNEFVTRRSRACSASASAGAVRSSEADGPHRWHAELREVRSSAETGWPGRPRLGRFRGERLRDSPNDPSLLNAPPIRWPPTLLALEATATQRGWRILRLSHDHPASCSASRACPPGRRDHPRGGVAATGVARAGCPLPLPVEPTPVAVAAAVAAAAVPPVRSASRCRPRCTACCLPSTSARSRWSPRCRTRASGPTSSAVRCATCCSATAEGTFDVATSATPGAGVAVPSRFIIGRRFQTYMSFGRGREHEVIEVRPSAPDLDPPPPSRSRQRRPARRAGRQDQRGRRQRPRCARQRLGAAGRGWARRDFTVNALFTTTQRDASSSTTTMASPTLTRSVLRMIGDPAHPLPRGPGAHHPRGAFRRPSWASRSSEDPRAIRRWPRC